MEQPKSRPGHSFAIKEVERILSPAYDYGLVERIDDEELEKRQAEIKTRTGEAIKK